MGMEIKTRPCLLETVLSEAVFIPRSPLRFHGGVSFEACTGSVCLPTLFLPVW